MNLDKHSHKRDKFISKLNDIVLENYTNEQFGASDLVEHYGISRSQLHRKLKSATGQSVSQFIREFRLEESLKLLQNEDTTASEVAYKVGFNSPTYFNTCFNEYFGFPPGETQYQMALAKSNNPVLNKSLDATSADRGSFQNRRLLIWFVSITLMVSVLFIYKYSYAENEDALVSAPEKAKTIAVLPLSNWSGDVEKEFISDGITAAIINKLSGIQSIERVVPFTSIRKYKDTDKDVATIADELGIEYILEGNFKLSGDQVQCNLKLIDVETSKQVWFLEYSGLWKTDEIFELQAAVAENVAEKLRAQVTSREREEINTKPTENSEAYMLFLEGLYQINVLDNPRLENAIPLFERAIQLDSSFIEPYLALGDNYLMAGLVWGIFNEQEAWSKAKPYFEKALELDSLNGGKSYLRIKSSVVNGKFHYEWDLESMDALYNVENAKLNPFIGLAYYDYSRKMGRFQESMNFIDIIIATDPLRSIAFMSKGIIHYFEGEEEKALKLFETYNKTSSSNYFYLMETAKYYYYMDKIELSKRQLQRLLDNFDDRPPIVLWMMAVHAQLEGNEIVLNESLDKLQSNFNENTSGSPAWFIALYYCHIEDYDNAFEWLEKSYDHHEVEMMWLKEEPMLRSLRTDPRYIDLYDKVGLSKISPITPFID